MAVLLAEPGAERLAEVMATTADLAISAGTLAEALIVAGMRGIGPEMQALVAGLAPTVLPVDAVAVAAAYAAWGRGRHPAALNFGDCFAAAAAKVTGAPLLFVGEDFSRTDLPVVAVGRPGT